MGNFRGDRDYSQMDLGQCDRVWWEYGGVVRGTSGYFWSFPHTLDCFPVRVSPFSSIIGLLKEKKSITP